MGEISLEKILEELREFRKENNEKLAEIKEDLDSTNRRIKEAEDCIAEAKEQTQQTGEMLTELLKLRLLICLNENEKRQWCLIYFVCKYSEEDCSSQGELTDVIKYAALCRITGLVSSRSREITRPSLTREVRTTDDASPKFAHLVLRNACRPNVTSPDYLPNLGSLDHDGNADSNRSGGKKFLGHIVQGNFIGKAAYVSQN